MPMRLPPNLTSRVYTPQFQKFDGQIENTREHVVYFYDSIGAHAHNAMHYGILQVLDGSGLHLVLQSKARFGARLGAPHVVVHH